MTRRGSIDALAARLTGLYDAREARSIALAAVAELSGLSPSALLTDPEAELAVEGLEESAARLAAGEPVAIRRRTHGILRPPLSPYAKGF